MTDDQLAVRETRYEPPSPDVPFEVLDVATLVRRVGLERLGLREHIDFDLAIVCTGGHGVHDVDFDKVPLVPRRVLHVRAGQVHRWILDGGYDADLFLFRRVASLPPAWVRPSPVVDLTDDEWHDLQPLVQLVRHERRSGPIDTQQLLAQQTLLVHALRLDRTAVGASPQATLHAKFRQAHESGGNHSRSVTQYARALGCSARTLTRACQAATGRTAKELLDDHVVLQARRLLSLPGRTAASVAAELGFSEPSNFAKFFVRLAGQTPAAWQAATRVHPG